MADLASTDVTITVQKRKVVNGQRRNLVKIAFGNGTLTYPTNGVPMPAKESFGMPFALDYLTLVDSDDASGIVWKYDKENKKLRGYLQGITVGAAGAVAVDDFPLDTTADPLASTVSTSLTGSTGAGTKYFGKMKELVNTQAPAAQVLYAEAVGS